MYELLLSLIALPLLAVFIDGGAGIIARRETYEFGTHLSEDFTILVPIWGRMKYLETVEYLRQYGNRILLCTTGNESDDFYTDIERIATENGFRIFRDEPLQGRHKVTTHKQRATSGTIRDRLVRNALNTVVNTTYVIPLDADTTTRQNLNLLAGELERRGLDIASIRLVPTNRRESLLTRLQYHEYRLAMQLRFLTVWAISGACHVAKTEVLRDIMNRHSLFFQGNDIETGLIAHARKYDVGHIPFDVLTAVPSGLKAWFRQRLAWAGGEFRLFIVNARFVFQHPFFWAYGGLVAIMAFPLRWIAISHPGYPLLATFGLYLVLAVYLYWKTKDAWLPLMPFYALFSSLIMTPLGVLWYFKMALTDGNFGIIRPKRKLAAGTTD